MAIDDNTSYELTGAQVKDLANKIKAKAADNIFVGATSAAPGSKGLVPAPQAADDTKFLSGDGTWKTVSGGASKTVFIWENGAMYDEDYNAISGGDVYTALQSSDVEVNDSGFSSLIVENGTYTSWTDPTYGALSDVRFFTTEQTSLTGVITRTQYLYDEASGNGWLTPRTMNIQEQLTAGSNISISGSTISATDTTYSNFTGATSSVAGSNGLVPAPASGDQEKVLHGDGTWKDTTAKLVEMSYGESNAWAKFIAAYNAGSIVYCRASSNANPGTGSQTRKAFMAYVNNATSPTNVEFQYVRSQSSKTDSQQCDQVFVYKLTNASGGTWTVESRNMAPNINVSGPVTKTFTAGANATITIGADAMTGATSSAAGTAGVVPAPAAGDEGKFLKGDGTWATAGGGATIPTIYLSDDDIMISGSIFGNMAFPNGGFVFCSTPITGGNVPMSESDMLTLLASGCPIRIEGSIVQDGYSTGYGLITCYNDNMGQSLRVRVEYMGTNQLFLGTATVQGTDPNNDGVRWGWMQG